MENSPKSPPPTDPPEKERRNPITSILVAAIGAFSAVYLLNPGWGWIELIPDNIPVFGNLDEAGAAALLISALAYFGVDLGNLFGKARGQRKSSARPTRDKSDAIDAEFVDR